MDEYGNTRQLERETNEIYDHDDYDEINELAQDIDQIQLNQDNQPYDNYIEEVDQTCDSGYCTYDEGYDENPVQPDNGYDVQNFQ